MSAAPLRQGLGQRVADQLRPLLEGKQRRLARMDADRDDNLCGDVQRLDQNIQMSIGDRVEGPGIKSCRHTDPAVSFRRLLSRMPASRK